MNVWLDGQVIEVDGEVVERQISPFSAKMSMGDQEFPDYLPHSVREYADLRGGISLEAEEKQTDRLWFSSSIEATKARYFTLGTLVSTVADFTTPLLKAIDFEGKTYFFGTSLSQYWDGALLQTADSSPLATPTDALVVTDATDTYLVVCNGTSARYCSVGYGASKDWAALTSSPIKYMCVHDKRLIGIDSSGKTVYYSARDNIDSMAGGAMDSFNISGEWTAAMDIWEGKTLTSDEPAIYMLTKEKLVIVDFYIRVAYTQEVRYPPTGYAMVGMYWNADVYVGTGSGIAKITPNNVAQFGADQDDGLPTGYNGYVYDMAGTAHWIVAVVSGGTYSTIMKRHETVGGWHQVYSSTSNIRCLHFSSITSPGYLWFTEGNILKYCMFPDTTHDISKVSGMTFHASGNLELPRLSKLSILPKTALQVAVLTSGCSATETVTVKYKINAETSYTTLGSAITANGLNTVTFGSNLGLAFYDIQLRLDLARGSTTTNTPVIKSIALKFIPAPDVVSAWTFNLAARGSRAKKIIDAIVATAAKKVLVKFSPVGDLDRITKYVKVESYPSRQDASEHAQEKKFTVVVTEVYV